MAYIRKIRFDKVGKNEGCTCDRCGQYIRNIWTVTYHDGVSLHFGIDCFDKLNKEKLSKMGLKLMNKALKDIEWYHNDEAEFMELTEETDIRWQNTSNDPDSYWHGHDYGEYRKWMLEKWYPARYADAQKVIDRFSKVNFNR